MTRVSTTSNCTKYKRKHIMHASWMEVTCRPRIYCRRTRLVHTYYHTDILQVPDIELLRRNLHCNVRFVPYSYETVHSHINQPFWIGHELGKTILPLLQVITHVCTRRRYQRCKSRTCCVHCPTRRGSRCSPWLTLADQPVRSCRCRRHQGNRRGRACRRVQCNIR